MEILQISAHDVQYPGTRNERNGMLKLAPWIKTLLGLDMKTGSHIYYKSVNGNTYPGIVIDIKHKIKVKINHYNGDREVWVNKANVELQSDN